MVAHLEASLTGIYRLDLVLLDFGGQDTERLRDIPFDPASGEVIITPHIARIRALPASTARARLVSVDEKGERVIGEYTFNHTPSAPA